MENAVNLSSLEEVDIFSLIKEQHGAFNSYPSDWKNWKTYIRLELDEEELVISLTMAPQGYWTLFQRNLLPLEIESGRTSIARSVLSDRDDSESPLSLKLRAPRSLQEFREFWDLSKDGLFIHRATVLGSAEWRFLNAVGLVEQGTVVEISDREPTQVDLEITMALLPLRVFGDGREIPTEFGQVTRAGGFALVNRPPVQSDGGTQVAFLTIPVLSDQHRLSVHTRIERIAGASGWSVGSGFARSFSELDKLTTGLQDLEFEQIERLLTNEARRIGESFQIFGVQFQVGLVNRIGLVAIFTIHLYLGIHYQVLSQRLRDPSDLAWQFPWVGVYRSILSKIAFIVSAVLLPSLLCCIIGIRQWISLGLSFESLLSIAAGLTSIIIGVWISMITFAVWRRMPV